MKDMKIATTGPTGADSIHAVKQYAPESNIVLCSNIAEVISLLAKEEVDRAVIPVYNTREGEVKEYFRFADRLHQKYWIDNVVLPIHLSLGVVDIESYTPSSITTLIGRSSTFKQCDEYLAENFSDATRISVNDIEKNIAEIVEQQQTDVAIIDSESFLKARGLQIAEREVVSHNRTRFAVFGNRLAERTGYDATAIITKPLNDRVGMLVDILNEFTRRGVNILDLRSENDIKTQKLQIYIEAEGHIEDDQLSNAINTIEKHVVQDVDAVKLLGSFPRVDMRIKQIKTFGFIGTGQMSVWFANRLENEGYNTILTGRNTEVNAEQMIPDVDVVIVCVPISVTTMVIEQYASLLKQGQALIILAGESEKPLQKAIEVTESGVEVMLVHNLWGPQTQTMKDKNVSVVRTSRSGAFCSEFEAFLYKHGADISHDNASQHDLLMGVGQKLPTLISVALAKTLKEQQINCDDISSHSTLTSLYGILSMVRVHNQNPRTYAEIMSTSGKGRKIVKGFVDNISLLMDMAEREQIAELSQIMEKNKTFMSKAFVDKNMQQAKAVDTLLSDSTAKDLY